MNDFEKSIIDINRFLRIGYALRIDVGLSRDAPYLTEWCTTNKEMIVIGFEPNIESFECIKSKVSQMPIRMKRRVFLFNMAIDDIEQISTKDFYVTGSVASEQDPGNSSLLKPIGAFKNSVIRIDTVTVISLCMFLEGVIFESIQFLKIDTQGNDLLVIKSLKEMLNKVVFLQAERDCTLYYENSHTGKELDQYLGSNHFINIKNFKSFNNEDSIYFNSKVKEIDFIPLGYCTLLLRKITIIKKIRLKNNMYELGVISRWIYYRTKFNLNIGLMRTKHCFKRIIDEIKVRP
jgi:FkbM family methyltransferase